MIEVPISIPLAEYDCVRGDLEASFTRHGLLVTLSADTVIQTWASLKFDDWFDKQDTFVDHYIGWGEIFRDAAPEPMFAAAPADFVDECCQVRVVMIFHDDDEDDDHAHANAKAALAMLFKLSFGGR